MSKKDYQAIARAIFETRQSHPSFSQHFEYGDRGAADTLAGKLADVFYMDNRRFDHARFIEACRTGHTKGMPRG